MTAMLVARRYAIPFFIPTRIRIPQEMYGFCTAHHTDSFVTLRPTTPEDHAWAETFLAAFERRDLKPALKKSSRSFADVLRLMPSHFRSFRYEVRRSSTDPGNDFTRYPLWLLVVKYVRRRINLFFYLLVRPAERSVSVSRPYCLYALHTQPESSIDVQGSYFSDQIELIRHIARSLPASHVLYVKVHPTDVDGQSLKYYRRIKAIPSVVLVDFSVDSRMLQESASIIFALTGTIAYEAGLLQKSVIVFARNYFNALPTIHHCTDPTALPALVYRILRKCSLPSAGKRRQVLSFMARMRAACFDGEVSRVYGASDEPLRETDLQEAQKAYLALWKVLRKNKKM
jgi:Capsule polysaccharide biosynthesis protein